MQWTIAPSGAVASAHVVRSTLGNSNVETCLVARVKSWTFPADDTPTTVTYPFTFASA